MSLCKTNNRPMGDSVLGEERYLKDSPKMYGILGLSFNKIRIREMKDEHDNITAELLEIGTVPKKRGRKAIGANPMTEAGRKSRARSFNMTKLCDGKEAEISTSGLIDLLPKLIGDKKILAKAVLNELLSRI